MKLNELFNTAANVKWTGKSKERWTGNFAVDGMKYFIEFYFVRLFKEQMHKNIWEVQFAADLETSKKSKILAAKSDDTTGIIGTGNAAQIFSIVLKAINEFIAQKKPDGIYLEARERNRQKLYGALLKRFAKNYKIETQQQRSSKGWIVYLREDE